MSMRSELGEAKATGQNGGATAPAVPTTPGPAESGDGAAEGNAPRTGVRAIIVAGGSGSRFTGSFIPKQFVQVRGKPILAYVLETYQGLSLVDDITLVINRRYEQLYYDIVDTYGFYKVRHIVPGGSTRQASSAAGLAAIDPCDVVVVQDGVRPFTSAKVIMEAVETARRVGGANVVVRALDTVVECRDGFIERIPDRNHLYNGQSPQAFRYDLLLAAHERAAADGLGEASDDAQLVLRVGGRVGLVEGSYENFKITTYEDFLFACAIVERQIRMSNGEGKW
jgi:2-C-methyl-D-erythritol 4-phosphate cytidylyltransferase